MCDLALIFSRHLIGHKLRKRHFKFVCICIIYLAAFGQTSLRISIDQQNLLTGDPQSDTEIDCSGCFPNAAFLVGDGNHFAFVFQCFFLLRSFHPVKHCVPLE